MKKYGGYEKAEAYTGDYETLKPGGYICVIKQVVCEEKQYGHLLRISFDISEGDYKDFYKRKYLRNKVMNPEAKWPGMHYQTVKQDKLQYFKGFITSVEKSNLDFKWDWDESKLVGKLFGGIFGEEEFLWRDDIKTTVRCRFVRSVEQIREGNFKVPDIKRLEGQAPNDGFYANDDDDLPF